MNDISIIILAGGKGTRLKSEVPKPLVELHGKPLIQPIIELSLQLPFTDRVIVVWEATKAIADRFADPKLTYVEVEPLGTGYVTMKALEQVHTSKVVIAQADDSYFYTEELLTNMVKDNIVRRDLFTIGVVDFGTTPYSAVDVDANMKIIRMKTSEEDSWETGSTFSCAGLYVGDTNWLKQILTKVPPSKNGEIGLPYLWGVTTEAEKDQIHAFNVPKELWHGVNTPEELDRAKVKMKDLKHEIRNPKSETNTKFKS